jgi:hypothetical protein
MPWRRIAKNAASTAKCERIMTVEDYLIGPICEIADLELTESDMTLNKLISAARAVRDREGFLVEHVAVATATTELDDPRLYNYGTDPAIRSKR